MEKVKYYNHSLVPCGTIKDELSLSKEELREAFKKYKKALFLTYTSNFDCGYDTGWYYVIKDDDEDYLSKMSRKHRYNLSRISRFVECREIVASDYSERIKEIGFASVKNYSHYKKNSQHFSYSDSRTIVGAFVKNSDTLIGFEIIGLNGNEIDLVGEKCDPTYRSLGASYALNEYIVKKYLPEVLPNGGYISNGSKNVVHETNHHQFLIDNLGFRYAYCYLHIEYRNSMKVLIPILRVLKPLLKLFDRSHLIHSVNSVLVIDKIVRQQKRRFKDYV